jgi:hypothetical protein
VRPSFAAKARRVEAIGSLRQKLIYVLLQDGLQQMGLDAEFGGNDARHTRGPVQQRVAHGAGDFINRRIGGCDIKQPALAFIQCEALGFHLQGELRNLEAGEGRALGRRAASKWGTLRVRGFQQPGACLGDVPLAIGLVRSALCMVVSLTPRRRAASRVEGVSSAMAATSRRALVRVQEMISLSAP